MGAFKTWPETMLADYVAGGFVEQPEGKVELACAPVWEASNYAAQAHDQAPTLILTERELVAPD